MTSHRLAAPHLKAGQGQVGLTINIRHMAPTPLCSAPKFGEINSRRLRCRSSMNVEWVQRTSRTNTFVINMDKYTERLRKKFNG